MNIESLKLLSFYPALVKFIADVNKLIADDWKSAGFTHNSPPEIEVGSVGGRYAKLVRAEQSPPHTGPRSRRGLYCFVDLQDGSLLKGSWKAPVKNGIRGNLSDPNVLNNFDQYGPKYLR